MNSLIAPLTQNTSVDETQPHFELHQCYISDASVELPLKGKTFALLHSHQPKVELSVEFGLTRLSAETLEVNLRASARCMHEGRALFLVEVVQSGIFTVRNIPDHEREMLENVQTVYIVHPYLRASFHDMLARANLPPLILPEINWHAQYEEKKRAAAATASAARTDGSLRLQ